MCHPQTTSVVEAGNTIVGSLKSQSCGNSPDSWSSSALWKFIKLSRICFSLLQPIFLHAFFQKTSASPGKRWKWYQIKQKANFGGISQVNAPKYRVISSLCSSPSLVNKHPTKLNLSRLLMLFTYKKHPPGNQRKISFAEGSPSSYFPETRNHRHQDSTRHPVFLANAIP